MFCFCKDFGMFAKKFSVDMKKRQDVVLFLQEFAVKSKIWDILIRSDRTNQMVGPSANEPPVRSDKNMLTLLELEISFADVKRILFELTCEDYSEGPIPDNLYHVSDIWVFGKIIKKREVYIKIQPGHPNSQTICISFHFSTYKMRYPLKNDII